MTPEAAAELLKACAGESGETEEAVEFGQALYALSTVDEALAERIVAAVSAFFSEHCKRVAIAFYKAGEAAGRQQAHKKHDRRTRPTAPRLQ